MSFEAKTKDKLPFGYISTNTLLITLLLLCINACVMLILILLNYTDLLFFLLVVSSLSVVFMVGFISYINEVQKEHIDSNKGFIQLEIERPLSSY